jgi:hypothetical protein
MLGTERKPMTGWRRGWDSYCLPTLISRKLLILHYERTAKSHTKAEPRYMAGTRHASIGLPSIPLAATTGKRTFMYGNAALHLMRTGVSQLPQTRPDEGGTAQLVAGAAMHRTRHLGPAIPVQPRSGGSGVKDHPAWTPSEGKSGCSKASKVGTLARFPSPAP